IERHFCGVVIRGGDMMKGAKIGNREVVRYEHSIESPFMAEHVGEQVPIAVRRDTVNLVVGRHHTLRMCFFHTSFKWLQQIFANHPFRQVTRADIGSTLWLAVNGKMFEGCED